MRCSLRHPTPRRDMADARRSLSRPRTTSLPRLCNTLQSDLPTRFAGPAFKKDELKLTTHPSSRTQNTSQADSERAVSSRKTSWVRVGVHCMALGDSWQLSEATRYTTGRAHAALMLNLLFKAQGRTAQRTHRNRRRGRRRTHYLSSCRVARMAVAVLCRQGTSHIELAGFAQPARFGTNNTWGSSMITISCHRDMPFIFIFSCPHFPFDTTNRLIIRHRTLTPSYSAHGLTRRFGSYYDPLPEPYHAYYESLPSYTIVLCRQHVLSVTVLWQHKGVPHHDAPCVGAHCREHHSTPTDFPSRLVAGCRWSRVSSPWV